MATDINVQDNQIEVVYTDEDGNTATAVCVGWAEVEVRENADAIVENNQLKKKAKR